MPIGDIWRVAFEGHFLGSQYVNVWHFKQKTASPDVEDVIDYVVTNFYDLTKTQGVSSEWTLEIANARKLTVPAVLFSKALSVQGGGTPGTELPPQSALVITLRSNLAGRRHRGRMYLGGYLESVQNAGTWQTSTVNAIQTYVDDLVTALGNGGTNLDWIWGIWSRRYGGEDPGPYNLTEGWTDIYSAVVRDTVHTQRRRVAGVGR